MKYLFLSLAILLHIHSFGQKQYATKEDLKNSKEIIFYGYDFSHFKLAEAKRIDKNISAYVPAWIKILNEFNDEKYLEKKLKKDKVIFDFDYTNAVTAGLKDDSLVSIAKHTIPPDSVQHIISSYQVKQKEGIGFVVIVECFEKATNISSAYFTFFDISTKKIILSDKYSLGGHASGMGLSKYWGGSLKATMYYYLDEAYPKQLKTK